MICVLALNFVNGDNSEVLLNIVEHSFSMPCVSLTTNSLTLLYNLLQLPSVSSDSVVLNFGCILKTTGVFKMPMPGLLLYLHNWSDPSVQSTLIIHYFEPHCKLLWQRPLFIIVTAQESQFSSVT